MLELQRYSRQTLFPGIGPEGQMRLLQSRVAIVGLGALGTVLANHMVRAGTGFVRLIDRDFVEPSNLQRQMLYDEQDALQSMAKAQAAAIKLRQINSSVHIEAHVTDLNRLNSEELLNDVDLILDGSDNFSVRFLINDIAVKQRIPWVYGGAVSSRGSVLPIIPGSTPCLRCLFANAPEAGTVETCDTAGVIAPIIDIVASYQATFAFKILTGQADTIKSKMLHIDPWDIQYSAVDVSRMRKPDCPACALGRYDFLEYHRADGELVQSLCGRDSVQIQAAQPRRLNLTDWAERWRPLGVLQQNPFLLKLKLDSGHTLVLFPDGRLLVQGTDDVTFAKSCYSRFVGH